MRHEVLQLAQLGPFPSEDGQLQADVDERKERLHSISRPLSNEEACLLATLFGPDTFCGLAWTMLTLIETAPDWPIRECLNALDNGLWGSTLKQRAKKYWDG